MHLHDLGIDLVGLGGDREHHVEEVRAVRERVLRIDERLADRLLVRERRDCAHLRDEPRDGDVDLVLVVDVERVGVVARERARPWRESMAIGCAVDGKPSKKCFMSSWMSEWRVSSVEKRLSSLLVRQVPVDEQVRRLDERRLLGELLDRDAAVAEDALLAVEERDRALRRRRVHERGVDRHEPVLARSFAMSIARSSSALNDDRRF